MALVRCPTHKIPYNEENPRGCPACAAEREKGASAADAMRDLARASKGVRAPTEEEINPRPSGTAKRASGALRVEDDFEDWPPPVTTPPMPPTMAVTRMRALVLWVERNRALSLITGLSAAGFLWLLWAVVPRFSAELDPPLITGDARPLPLEPSQQISAAFAILGVLPPEIHPEDRRLARYTYGRDLAVNEYNGFIYSLSLLSPTYAWRGLRVSAPELHAAGSLALLGTATEAATRISSQDIIGGYRVYRSRDLRPQRTLTVKLRPPNGCVDVEVHLEPRIIGRVARGSQRFVAVSKRNGIPEWVVTTVEIINRSVQTAGGDRPPC